MTDRHMPLNAVLTKPTKPLLSPLSVGQVDTFEKKALPELPPVAAFDMALLPESLQPWATDICERMQCPPDFVGVTIMAGLATVLGRKIGIRPQELTDWTEYPNLWALVVGRPGVLKTPAMEAALGPLKRLAAEAIEAHLGAEQEFKLQEKAAKLREKALEGAAQTALKKNPGADVAHMLAFDEPELPTLRRYIANDTTAASLGELVRQNPNGLLVHRDEMVSLLRGLDREDAADARGFYLTAWGGNSGYTFDRIGRGFNLHIPAVCLSLLGSTQPGRVAEYIKAAVSGGSGDDGLFQRFGMLVWPDISASWREVDAAPDARAKDRAFEVYQYLDQIQPEHIRCEQDRDGSYYLRFDADGLREFRQWREAWERKLRSGDLHPAMESHLAKYRKLIPGIALILHLADYGTGHVSAKAVVTALAWGEYLETHAVRAYASVTQPEVHAAKAILRRIEKGDVPLTFTARDIYRSGWSGLTDSKAVNAALSMLATYGHLIESHVDTDGRPSTIYEVVP